MTSTASHATNLILNSSFEDDGFNNSNLRCPMSAWTGCVGINAGETSKVDPTLDGHAAYLAIGTSGSLGFVSQTIATTAGQNYLFTFDYSSDGASGNAFQAKFGGTVVMNLSGGAFNANWPNFNGGATHGFIVTATGSTTTVSFGGEGNGSSFIGVDDVSVVQSTAGATVQNTGSHGVNNPLLLTGSEPISSISGNLGPSDLIDSYEFTLCHGGLHSCGSTRELKIDASFTDVTDSICLNLFSASNVNIALKTVCGESAFLDVLNLAVLDGTGNNFQNYILTVTENGVADPSYNVFFETPVDAAVVAVTPVPEPATLMLFGAPLASIAFLRRRRAA